MDYIWANALLATVPSGYVLLVTIPSGYAPLATILFGINTFLIFNQFLFKNVFGNCLPVLTKPITTIIKSSILKNIYHKRIAYIPCVPQIRPTVE